ncbi:hypothetical protein K461DRAFT_63767 [Myriangium duriaei CBS 260.36]|uniref:Uncharacterized protein n=1 Tax=Myriangium duriaei CBS 260.36 TaxID=1168546 RepID=A0A9P4MI19_9PEZI|nr:hypothetical protein K461DRAFT_63767 [Myriangium duriaei CBS 260.36]
MRRGWRAPGMSIRVIIVLDPCEKLSTGRPVFNAPLHSSVPFPFRCAVLCSFVIPSHQLPYSLQYRFLCLALTLALQPAAASPAGQSTTLTTILTQITSTYTSTNTFTHTFTTLLTGSASSACSGPHSRYTNTDRNTPHARAKVFLSLTACSPFDMPQ